MLPADPPAKFPGMTIRGKAYIAGIFEHPGRELPDLSVPQIHAEVAAGALADAGLGFGDVDAYLCAGDAPGFGPLSMAEYLGCAAPTWTAPRPAARRTSVTSATPPRPSRPASAAWPW